jgi:hypothetical protein
MSVDSFDRLVRPEIRVVYPNGRGHSCKVLVPVHELESWVEENAVRTLGLFWRAAA